MLKSDKCHRYGSLSDEPTKYQNSDICRIIRLATNTAFRCREQHKVLSYSLSFENDPIQRLLNGQIVAPSRGANTYCKGLHCRNQRLVARVRHLLAGVRRRRGVRCLTIQLTIHSNNKGMMWAPGLAARASQHEP